MKLFLPFIALFCFWTTNVAAPKEGEPRNPSTPVVVPEKTFGPNAESYLYIPDSTTPIKYIRVNMHFMLKSIGDVGYPGNFTPTHDGHGNTAYTGFDYAQELIAMANLRLSVNTKMALPPGNSTPVLETKYRYVLDGVYFHENSDFYCADYLSTFSKFKKDAGRAINLFMFCPLQGVRGTANMENRPRYVFTTGAWKRYSDYLDNPQIGDGIWATAQHLNHEIGHNLSLHHTLTNNQGICKDHWEDYCPDTPTRGEIKSEYGLDPCGDWNTMHQGSSNNLMDYGNGGHALTPHQLGRIHWTLENEMQEYLVADLPAQLIHPFDHWMPDICMITVDMNDNNLVIWERPLNVAIDSVIIYRENPVEHAFYKIGVQCVDDNNHFIDTASGKHPDEYRYKLSFLDNTRTESFQSNPHKPINLSLGRVPGGMVSLQWAPYEGFEYSTFYVYRGIRDAGADLIAMLAADVFSFTDSNPPSGELFYYVEVIKENGCPLEKNHLPEAEDIASRSGKRYINYPDDLMVQTLLTIYPNPASDRLNIILTGKNKFSASVLSLDGRVISRTVNDSQIDLSDILAGIYVLRLETEGEVLYRKFVRN